MEEVVCVLCLQGNTIINFVVGAGYKRVAGLL